MAHSIAEEIMEQVNNLPPELQKKVLEYARGLEPRRANGVTSKGLLKLAGTISDEDADTMIKAIEEGCERVDLNEW